MVPEPFQPRRQSSSPKCGNQLETTACRPVLQADQASARRVAPQSRGQRRQSASCATARCARSRSSSGLRQRYAGWNGVLMGLFNDVSGNRNWNTAADARRCRALLLVRGNGTLGSLTLAGRNAEVVVHAHPCDAQDAVHGLDIAFDPRPDPVRLRRNLTHFQCACQRAEQSTADRRDHVVEGRGKLVVVLDTVEVLDPVVLTEPARLLERYHA